ncbi:MAG: type II toxin-antitoxin system VapC family toxin [Acidiferrobacterales bacterium]
MNSTPLRAVMDASVAVKVFVPELHSAEARAILERFTQEEDAELVVPDLFFIECANVFWKWVQRSGYPSQDVQEHLHDLGGLGFTVLPTQFLAEDALEVALRHKVTAYDACYIAAAAKLGLPLITADEKLVKRVDKRRYDIQWLGSMPLMKG